MLSRIGYTCAQIEGEQSRLRRNAICRGTSSWGEIVVGTAFEHESGGYLSHYSKKETDNNGVL